MASPLSIPFSESRRPGYVWRQIGIERLEERDGGVYVELETIVLSRGIPAGFHWLIKPLADELPRKLMRTRLSTTHGPRSCKEPHCPGPKGLPHLRADDPQGIDRQLFA